MTLSLPVPITAYFAADPRGGDAVAACFTPDGIVRDEAHEYKGHAAIAGWKADASARYRYTVDPLSVLDEGGAVVVTGRVSGNFPGSPVDLRYAFHLQDDLIAVLEIRP